MPKLGNHLDFSQYQAISLRAHNNPGQPSGPVSGQIWYDNTSSPGTLYYYNNVGWIPITAAGAPADATTTTKGIVQLAGDLAGTAAAPQIAAGAIVDADVAAANKDGGAAVPSLRTLGTGALQAAAGNDARFTDSRAPTGAAGGDLAGSTYPNPVIAALAVTDAKVAAANKDGAVGTYSMRTLGAGAQQAMPGNRTLDAITAPIASLSLNSQRIVSLADPTGAQDAATKNYVDTFAQGLDSHPSVHAATVGANITLAGSAPNTLDGVTLAANDRVLVKDQTTPAQNGIYVVSTLGTGANGTWVRATDQDTWAEVPSAYVWVEMGTVNADTGWTCTSDPGGTLGTTAITWAQFSSAGSAIAGAGLTKTGNTLDVVGTTNRISVAADSVDIAATYVGQTSITTLGTITSGTWNGTAVGVGFGGTGQTTAKAARETGLAAGGYYNNNATHGAGTTITITQATHGLRASRAILVQVQDNATGNVELPDVSVAATGDVTITYGAALTANTKLVTLVG
jgi:uncharacterized protein DUF5907